MTTKSKPTNLASSIRAVVTEGTRKWTDVRKREKRNPVSRRHRSQVMRRETSVGIKEAAWEIMEEAYNKRLIPLTQVRLYVVGAARGAGRRFCEDCLA
jgi:hypothetical protein